MNYAAVRMNSHHGAIADTNTEEFSEPLEDALLNVRKIVFATQRFDLGLDLLVLRHREVGKQMVLNLIIEPHLGIVNPVVSGLVVHRSQYLIHVKLLFVLVMVVKAKQVGAGVIGADDHVGVEVGDELGQDSIDEHEQHRGFPQREKEQRDDHKVEHEKGQEAGEPKLTYYSIAEVEEVGKTIGSDLPRVVVTIFV